MIQRLLFEADEILAENSQRGNILPSQFNVGMLILAREAKGYTQKELAERISCHQSRLSKIEAGELVPQESDFQNFGRVLA